MRLFRLNIKGIEKPLNLLLMEVGSISTHPKTSTLLFSSLISQRAIIQALQRDVSKVSFDIQKLMIRLICCETVGETAFPSTFIGFPQEQQNL